MVCWTCFCDLSSVADSIWMKWFATSSSSSDSFLQVLINETTDQQLLRLNVLHVHDLLLLLMHCTSMHLQKWYHLVLFVARIFILDCVGVSLQFFWLMILHVLILVRLTSLQNLVSTLPVFHVCMFLKFLPSLGKLHNCKATLQGKDLLCTTLYSCYTRAKGTHPSHLRNAWLK